LLVPQEPISFNSYIVPKGLQPGEKALPEDDTASSQPSLPPLNEAAFTSIQEMGFPANRAEKALRITGNESAEIALQWLFEHMDDPDIDVPFGGTSSFGGDFSIHDEKMENLMNMGFTETMSRKALQETVIQSP
jgi:ubiquitin carboxyl-terminal hydrolase 5/13